MGTFIYFLIITTHNFHTVENELSFVYPGAYKSFISLTNANNLQLHYFIHTHTGYTHI